MVKITIVGAGSHVFTKKLVTDILSFTELRSSNITLMDTNPERLNLITTFTKTLINQYGFTTNIVSTTNLHEALEGANYVILSIRVGGLTANRLDIEIPAKYGIIQGVGDTVGPGGIFYALRQIPVILEICHKMEDVCPDAWLLNYSNPMSMICWAVNDNSKIQNVGLCHSIQGTALELAHYIGAPIDEVSYMAAGINHMAWFLEFNWRSADAYPLLREQFKDPSIYSKPDAHWAGYDIVRAEIFKAFGYYVSESSQHMSEYVPYFRKRPGLLERYKLDYRLDKMNKMRQDRVKAEQEMRSVID
jgi:alpha-galactosidase